MDKIFGLNELRAVALFGLGEIIIGTLTTVYCLCFYLMWCARPLF